MQERREERVGGYGAVDGVEGTRQGRVARQVAQDCGAGEGLEEALGGEFGGDAGGVEGALGRGGGCAAGWGWHGAEDDDG